MKQILFILFAFTLGTAYSQLPTRLKLKQLEQGTPGQTIVVDSLGNAAYGSGGGDGNGIYSGSGEAPTGTLISTLDTSSSYGGTTPAIAIGRFPTWPTVYTNQFESGLLISPNWFGGPILIHGDSTSLTNDYASLEFFMPGGAYMGSYVDATNPGGRDLGRVNVESGIVMLEVQVNNVQVSVLTVNSDGSMAFNGIKTFVGSGSPEGVVAAPVSSHYHRTDGGAGTCFYVKETGTGNTGWVPK